MQILFLLSLSYRIRIKTMQKRDLQEVSMKKKIAIGIQNFEELIQKDYYYIDKTDFIREWWDCGDSVTLITRPRRFGKTLNISMVETFFL